MPQKRNGVSVAVALLAGVVTASLFNNFLKTSVFWIPFLGSQVLILAEAIRRLTGRKWIRGVGGAVSFPPKAGPVLG